MMLSLGLLVSGSLGHDVLSCLEANNPIVFVMTDKNSDKIIAFCDKKKIDCYVGNPREGRCSNFIHNLEIDILISINYLFLIFYRCYCRIGFFAIHFLISCIIFDF